ncbi:MAG: hypothetical protein Q7S12_03655 [bacterium]|nr:hypothetical protein [bacterium]
MTLLLSAFAGNIGNNAPVLAGMIMLLAGACILLIVFIAYQLGMRDAQKTRQGPPDPIPEVKSRRCRIDTW